jgi:hypothetical protein
MTQGKCFRWRPVKGPDGKATVEFEKEFKDSHKWHWKTNFNGLVCKHCGAEKSKLERFPGQ